MQPGWEQDRPERRKLLINWTTGRIFSEFGNSVFSAGDQLLFWRAYKPLITVAKANKTQAAISKNVEYSPTAGRSTPSTGRVPSTPMITAMIHVTFIGDLNCILPPKNFDYWMVFLMFNCLYIDIINFSLENLPRLDPRLSFIGVNKARSFEGEYEILINRQ